MLHYYNSYPRASKMPTPITTALLNAPDRILHIIAPFEKDRMLMAKMLRAQFMALGHYAWIDQPSNLLKSAGDYVLIQKTGNDLKNYQDQLAMAKRGANFIGHENKIMVERIDDRLKLYFRGMTTAFTQKELTAFY
ncbi:hypothetical protein [Vibrio phage BONAISHI]|nr:hypothetical protein [Vibrio phage BONAISHI]